MAEDFVVLHSSAEGDGDDSKLRGVLETHLRMEHARGIRELSAGLVAVLGLPVWVAANRPAWMAEGLRTFVLTAWFVSFVGFLTAVVSEWRWRRRLDKVATRRPSP